ncbi:MAG: class I SAM-dependent methyltransferase [Blastocatellia bacterium]
MSSNSEIHQKEAAFHDEWASSTDLSEVAVRAAFEAITAPENRFILSQMGLVKGKRILDVGAGLGESSVYFALLGAEVTMVDISPKMVELAVKLGKNYGVEIKGIVCAAESLNVPDNYYDFIYIGNLLHHLTDRAKLFQQVNSALKPGGRFFSWDPLTYNPVINIYRKIATKVRTEDESPLTMADLALAKQYFSQVGHREFWLLSLVIFLKYYLIDRVNPNSDRYWKRILKETDSSLWWFKPLQKIDDFLTQLPIIRWLAWNIVIWGNKK